MKETRIPKINTYIFGAGILLWCIFLYIGLLDLFENKIAFHLEISFFAVSFGFLLFGIITFLKARKVLVIYWFVVFCFHISVVFLGIFLMGNIWKISMFLLSFLPLSLYYFFSSFLQICVKSWITVGLFIIGFVSSIRFLINSRFSVWLLLLLIISAFASCLWVYIQLKRSSRSKFLHQYQKLLVVAVTVAFAPFTGLFIIPEIIGSPIPSQIIQNSVVTVLALPIAITYILVKNNALVISLSINLLIQKGISLLILAPFWWGFSLLLQINILFIPVGFLFLLLILCIHKIFVILLGNTHQKDPDTTELFFNEKTQIETDISLSNFYHSINKLVFSILPINTNEVEFLLLFKADSESEVWENLSSNMPQHIVPLIEQKFLSNTHPVDRLSFNCQDNIYDAFPLAVDDEIIGWFIFSSENTSVLINDIEKSNKNIAYICQNLAVLLFSIRNLLVKSSKIIRANNNETHAGTITNSLFRERKAFTEYLHNDILQNVLQIHNVAMNSKADEDLLKQLNALCKQIRTIIFDVLPPTLYFVNMYENLSMVIADFNDKSAKKRELTGKKTPLFMLNCPKDFAVRKEDSINAIYRIVKELNDNALYHSEATVVKTNIDISENMLSISVVDNGKGMSEHFFEKTFDKSATAGLLSIKYDVSVLGGEFRIFKNFETTGTHIQIHLPVEVAK